MEPKPNSFGEDMISLMAKFRTDLEEPELPLLLSEWEQGATGRWSPTTSTGKKVIEATNALPGMMSNCYVIPTGFSKDRKKYMNDDHHFNLAGNIVWADTAVKVIADNNLVPDHPADVQPPTAPANLTASNAGVSRIQLNWTASSDNDLVRNYILYSGGDSIGIAGSAAFLFSDARSCSTYSFSVRAVDFSGNRSALGAALSHSSVCSGDLLAPAKPAGLEAENISVASLVVAVDAAGNLSDPSEPFTVSTRSSGIALFPFSVNIGGGGIGKYQKDKSREEESDFGFEGKADLKTCPGDGPYATAREGDFKYKVSLPNGNYRVIMYFMECGASAPAQRVFSVNINNIPPIPIDIFKVAGANKEHAVTKDVLVTTGLLEMSLSSAGAGSPILSG